MVRVGGGTQLRYAGAILKGRIVVIWVSNLGYQAVLMREEMAVGVSSKLAVASLDLGHARFGQRVIDEIRV